MKFCLDFNVKKSKVMVIGKSSGDVCALKLHGVSLEYVSEYKYLGVRLRASPGLTYSATETIRSFYRAANSIFHSPVKPSNEVLMKLLYANCVPILTYACAVKEFCASDMHKCHVAVNNAIRKIFSFAVWQSIRQLRMSLGYDSIYEIFAKAKKKFFASAVHSSNLIIRHLAINCN